MNNQSKKVNKDILRFGEKISDIIVLKNQGAQDLGMYDFWKDECPKTIPYDLAKLAEDTLTVDLLAFNKKMVKFGKLKDVKDIAVPTKKAEIAIKTVKVSPLGRICYGEKEGEVEKYVAFFQYVDQEWICVGIHEKVPFPVSANPADNPQLYFEKVAEITPAVSKKLNDCPKCK